jgi:tetratricopeptide (TPR) repeat protein
VRIRFLILFSAVLTAISLAQNAPDKTAPDRSAPDAASANKSSTGSASADGSSSDQPASDKSAAQNPDAEASSSRDTRVDLTPPKDDDKNHPNSKAAAADLEPSDKPDTSPDTSRDTSDVQEFHPWNPMKAIKDIEVGDYYFRLKNYKGALARYKEALYYKDGDAVANFRIAKCQEKLGDKAEAKKYYEQYLRIVPDGPYAKDAHASLDKMVKAR